MMLPQYEVIEILGRGGMGAVYKARQKSLRRLVAIKILPRSALDDELHFVERFKNEAFTMAQLDHPAIVGVHDFGETAEGLLYFVMEFVDGTDVARMIQSSGRLPQDLVLKITLAVCEALHDAHQHGVIHRDIKPANVLIHQDGRVKVADFGLAKRHDPLLTHALTRSDTAIGTPDFVAPEMLLPGTVADHRADIYAVGVMLYQMLTGEIPRGIFKMPSQRFPELDERFNAIVCKAMETDREERYQSALDMRRDLEAIMITPRSCAALATTSAKAGRKVRRSVLVSLAAVPVLGVGAFMAFHRPPPQDMTKPAASSPAMADEPWMDVLGPWWSKGRNEGSYAREAANAARCIAFGWIQPLDNQAPPLRDQAARFTVRMNDTEEAVLSVRYGEGPSSNPGMAYEAKLDSHRHKARFGFAKVNVGFAPLAEWDLPSGFDFKAPHSLELRAVADLVTVSLDGRKLGEMRNGAVGAGHPRAMVRPGAVIERFEYLDLHDASSKPAPKPVAAWTDWLDLKQRSEPRMFKEPGWVMEPDGISTGLHMKGTYVMPKAKDCTVRATYHMRGSNGILLTLRERKTATSREAYVADDTRDLLIIARELPDGSLQKLAREELPAEIRQSDERTLEFRCAGNVLTATVNGTFTVTATDSTLTEGLGTIVIERGVLLKKVLMQVGP